ncbi:MAG: alpha/beta hydrolase [Ilumatobacteraceae bacterium]
MPFVFVRDLEIYYEIHPAPAVESDGSRGDDRSPPTRPRVVLISGTGGDVRADPRRSTSPLATRCEVLMYDQRGLGRTSKPDVECTMAEYADDCVALMDARGWQRAHVMGISFGGMVAQHVALRHPDRVDRLVLACTSSGGAGGASFDLLSVADLSPSDRLRITLPVLDTRNDPTTSPPAYAPLFDVIAAIGARGPLNADDPGAAMGARRQLEARARHDTWDDLDRIDVPTLVLGGRFDGQAPPANVRALADRIPDAELRMFDGGHMFLLQDPAAWAAVVTFLTQSS